MPQAILELKSMALQVKAVEADGSFEGYCAVFGNLDAVGDIIKAGAFKDSLKEHKSNGTMPAMLWQHDRKQPIGVYASMKEDTHGLFVNGKLLKDDVRQAGEAYALLKAGAISGMSIGYYARDYSVDEKTFVRTLKKLDLVEASLVTFPANDKARVTGVKATGIITIRDFEAALRDELGFTWNEAKAIAARGFKARDEQDGSAELAEIINSITQKYN